MDRGATRTARRIKKIYDELLGTCFKDVSNQIFFGVLFLQCDL